MGNPGATMGTQGITLEPQGSPKWLVSMSLGLPATLAQGLRQPMRAFWHVLVVFSPSKRRLTATFDNYNFAARCPGKGGKGGR